MSYTRRNPNRINGDLQVIGGHITLDNQKYYRARSTVGVIEEVTGLDGADRMWMYNGSGGINIETGNAGDVVRFAGGDGSVGNRIFFEDGGFRGNTDINPTVKIADFVATEWCYMNMTTVPGAAFTADRGFDTAVDNGVGDWTLNFDTAKAGTGFAVTTSASNGATERTATIKARAVGSVRVLCTDAAGAASDSAGVSVMIMDGE